MGQYHGSIPTYGYCFHDGVHTKLHLDTEAASIVRGIFDQRLAGMSYADIARALNEKNLKHLRYIYKGKAGHRNQRNPYSSGTEI